MAELSGVGLLAQEPLVGCPGCGLKLPESAGWEQVRHMETEHPEIVAERLEAAGFRRVVENGEQVWVDTLS